MLLVALKGYLIKLSSIERLVDLNEFVFDSGEGVYFVCVKLEQLVWQDLILLKSKSLYLGPWESMYYPTLFLFFTSLDFSHYEVGYNLIIN